MRLTRVQIHNFRSIANVILPLEPQCRVLVGINEAGKTNILRALSLLSPQTSPSQADFREPRPGDRPDPTAFVRFIFQLDDNDRDVLYDSLQTKIVALDSDKPVVLFKETQQSLRSFCNTRKEALYQVDLRTGKRSCTSWTIPSTVTLLPGWMKPSSSSPPTATLSLRKGRSVAATDTSLVFSSDFPDLEGERGSRHAYLRGDVLSPCP